MDYYLNINDNAPTPFRQTSSDVGVFFVFVYMFGLPLFV
ncbi:hypothetical protein [Staphylococcus phage vB_Sau_MetB16]